VTFPTNFPYQIGQGYDLYWKVECDGAIVNSFETEIEAIEYVINELWLHRKHCLANDGVRCSFEV
jgi:hypothetical protein